jgi:hypothetical protein
LKNTRIKLRGKVSELIPSRIHKRLISAESKDLPTEELELTESSAEVADVVTEPQPMIIEVEDSKVKIPEISVKVVPTPAKRRRSAKVELAPKLAQPLKVIRRRREEAPKVLETPPKDYPKSMLEGIKVGYDE